ncbi:PREDICTED: uncharacterized protein LOC107071865 isoform X2 [Polistes dominula]|uniref:Phosphatidylinositol-glycan biosynthesis class X protein n=1 Tax=Polistes dominula TaxID=743375 RepID=A0ABM1J2P8_POLDO|nr:PREDICTED: uncharacterized protein LOC107071865 isoform X2 [Polistes dominula]
MQFFSHCYNTLRYFTYHIEVDNLILKDCYASLHFVLPSALYVNINELAELKRTDNTTICSVGETDTELFMENANSQNVTICSRIDDGSSIMSLPIHQRYQYPKENGDYETVVLRKPSLLLGCKERIKEYRVSKINLCPLCADKMVKWRELPYNTDEIEYEWTIPIGDISFLSFVTYITLIITSFGTVLLINTIWTSNIKKHLKKN